jgi:hypothetical protein
MEGAEGKSRQWLSAMHVSGHILFKQPNGTQEVEKELRYLDGLEWAGYTDYLDKLWLEFI